MSGIEDSKSTIVQLVDEHRKLENLVQRLQEARHPQLAPLLRVFADFLEAHIRTEELGLFPRYEQGVSSELAKHVAMRVLEVIGHPEASQSAGMNLSERLHMPCFLDPS
jgi:hemerythrin-like domain-containing protein